MPNILNYQTLGVIAALLIMLALTPLFWQLLKTKQLESIHVSRLILLAIASMLWIMYGFRDSSAAVVLLATYSFAITSMLFAIKLRSRTTS